MNLIRTDRELLAALRTGDSGAFEGLWRRHAKVVRPYAEKLLPGQGDDLVSESSIAIHKLISTSNLGPDYAFRPYLKTVIRNLAIRWREQSSRSVNAVDDDVFDRLDPRDGLSVVEDNAAAAEVAAAFRQLPERWQRVLWLAEAAGASRPEIAKDLGIKPNAVSALQKRARAGFKLQWLSGQIPIVLRDDTNHIARLIPQYLTEPRDVSLAAEVATHTAACALCNDLLRNTRGATARLQGGALGVLLGAAGVGLPAAASLSSGAAASAVVLAAGVSGWLIGGGVGAATLGSVVITTLLIGSPGPAEEVSQSLSAPTSAQGHETVPWAAPPSAPILNLPGDAPAGPAVPAPAKPPTGSGITDPVVPLFELDPDKNQAVPSAPLVPRPADPPGPASTPAPSEPAARELTPGISSPIDSSGYFAPVLAGRTAPGDQVAIAVGTRRYAPTVAGDGSWTFDTRALQLEAGTHRYQVWAYDDTAQSPAVTGTFTMLPLGVEGFDGLTGFHDMTISEGRSTGVVIAITGPSGGQVFITTISGGSAIVTLDDTGYTRKRLLLNSAGWYAFTFRALDGDSLWGPGRETFVDVHDPDVLFDPWGPDDGLTFDVVDP